MNRHRKKGNTQSQIHKKGKDNKEQVKLIRAGKEQRQVKEDKTHEDRLQNKTGNN